MQHLENPHMEESKETVNKMCNSQEDIQKLI